MNSNSQFNLEGVIESGTQKQITDWIKKEQWMLIWVPKIYGGLGLAFGAGLKLLLDLAHKDSSLGWMVTLCAGANYFSRNIKPTVAKALFKDKNTCLGGSGMIGGTARLINNHYLLNGTWRFATGAPYLTHFTINAKLVDHLGVALKQPNGEEVIKSFIISKDDVTIFPDWKCMGMKKTYTYSFSVSNVHVSEEYSFLYDVFYTQNLIDKIPFRIFADLTLLVNYLGMAYQFYYEAISLNSIHKDDKLKSLLTAIESAVFSFAKEVECQLLNGEKNLDALQDNIHQFGVNAVQSLAQNIICLYMQLGIIAATEDQIINQIFKDFFTATQHANFRS